MRGGKSPRRPKFARSSAVKAVPKQLLSKRERGKEEAEGSTFVEGAVMKDGRRVLRGLSATEVRQTKKER